MPFVYLDKKLLFVNCLSFGQDFFRRRKTGNGLASHSDGFKKVAQRTSRTNFINPSRAGSQ